MRTDDITISQDCDTVDWQALADLIENAPLTRRDPADLRRAFANSYAVCFAFSGGQIVGTARAMSDGVYYATVLDVCVHPDHQGRGIGRLVVGKLLERLPSHKVFLTSVPGKEGFYKKLGFLRQTNAMGLYEAEGRQAALARGVLVAE